MNKKKIAETTKAVDKQSGSVKELKKNWNDVKKGMDEYFKSSKKTLKGNVKYLSDWNDLLDDGVDKIKSMSKEISKLHMKEALNTDEAIALNSELEKIENQLVKISKVKMAPGTAEWKKQKEEVKKLNGQFKNVKTRLNAAKNTAASFTDTMAEAGPGFMKGWAKFRKASEAGETTIDKYGGLFNKAGNQLNKLPGLLGKTGLAAKGLGATLGGVSKIFAGWPGAIFMALKALWDIGMKADQFVKDANKSFARLRGPDIMTKDIERQFKDFNDQIYRTGANIRVGFNAESIRALLEAMVQAGLNITTLNKGLQDYRKAIFIAAKASRTLGLELPMVGAMVGKLITNFRMNLDEVDRAFVQVAFDAKKSGLSTDRFWTTIENATASLALYGVFISSASQTMKRFTEDMVGGADDAAEATSNMYDIFKTGALESQAALLDFAKQGGVGIKKMFAEASAELGEKELKIKGKITMLEAQDQTPEILDELKKSHAELYSVQSQILTTDKAMKGGTITQAAQMGILADKAPEILMAAVKGIAQVGDLTEISGNRMWVAIKGAAIAGVKEKTVRMLVREAQVTKARLTHLAESSDEHFKNYSKMTEGERKDLTTAIDKVWKKEGKTAAHQIRNGEMLAEKLTAMLGMSKIQADTWVDLLKSDDKNAKKMATLLKSGDKKNVGELKKLFKSSDVVQKYTASRFKEQHDAEGNMEDAARDTLKQITKQTLSYNEMIAIAKDEAKWRLSSLGLFQKMNQGIMSIFKWFVKDQSDYLSEGQIVAQDQIKRATQGNKNLENLIKETAKGNLTQESQRDLSIQIEKEMEKLDSRMVAIDKISPILEKIEKGTVHPVVAFEREIGELRDDMKKVSADDKKLYQDQIDELQRQSKDYVDTKKIYSGIEGALVNMASTEAKVRDVGLEQLTEIKEIAEKAENKELIEDINKYLALSIADAQHSEKFNIASEKYQDRGLKLQSGLKRKGEKDLEASRKEKTTLDTMKAHLETMDKNNAIVARLASLSLKSSPKYLESIAEEVKASGIKSSNEMLKFSKKFDVPLERIAEAIPKETELLRLVASAKILEAKEKREAAVKEEFTGAELTPGKKKIKQGLLGPEKVISPGNVILHTGETIFPASSEFKTIPVPTIRPTITGGAGGPGGPGVTGGGKELTINVTATEKDLAQKIANEVRAVIYREYSGIAG